MDAINSLEFDYVASGHYANVVHSAADQMDELSVLELSKDMVPIWIQIYPILKVPVCFFYVHISFHMQICGMSVLFLGRG